MAKILKSVNVEEKLLEYLERHNAILNKISGGSITFTDMVNEGCLYYLRDQCEKLIMYTQEDQKFEINGETYRIAMDETTRDELSTYQFEISDFIYNRGGGGANYGRINTKKKK